MLIEGPMNITITEPADGQGKVLVMVFTPEFQAQGLPERVTAFQDYISELQRLIGAEGGVDQRNRAGMAIVQQFAEQLLPYIQSDDLALEEQIVIQIRQEDQVAALQDLLASGGK